MPRRTMGTAPHFLRSLLFAEQLVVPSSKLVTAQTSDAATLPSHLFWDAADNFARKAPSLAAFTGQAIDFADPDPWRAQQPFIVSLIESFFASSKDAPALVAIIPPYGRVTFDQRFAAATPKQRQRRTAELTTATEFIPSKFLGGADKLALGFHLPPLLLTGALFDYRHDASRKDSQTSFLAQVHRIRRFEASPSEFPTDSPFHVATDNVFFLADPTLDRFKKVEKAIPALANYYDPKRHLIGNAALVLGKITNRTPPLYITQLILTVSPIDGRIAAIAPGFRLLEAFLHQYPQERQMILQAFSYTDAHKQHAAMQTETQLATHEQPATHEPLDETVIAAKSQYEHAEWQWHDDGGTKPSDDELRRLGFLPPGPTQKQLQAVLGDRMQPTTEAVFPPIGIDWQARQMECPDDTESQMNLHYSEKLETFTGARQSSLGSGQGGHGRPLEGHGGEPTIILAQNPEIAVQRQTKLLERILARLAAIEERQSAIEDKVQSNSSEGRLFDRPASLDEVSREASRHIAAIAKSEVFGESDPSIDAFRKHLERLRQNHDTSYDDKRQIAKLVNYCKSALGVTLLYEGQPCSLKTRPSGGSGGAFQVRALGASQTTLKNTARFPVLAVKKG